MRKLQQIKMPDRYGQNGMHSALSIPKLHHVFRQPVSRCWAFQSFAKRHKFSVSLNPGLQVSHLMRTAMTPGIRHVGHSKIIKKIPCWAFSTKKMELCY